jgi:hypothetical protein
MYDDFVEICKPIETINPDFPFKVSVAKPLKKPTRIGGTDNCMFAMNGVPIYHLEEQDVKGYDFQYRELWHTERDLYNRSIPEYMEHTSVVTAIVALGVANLKHLLPRDGVFAD